MSKELNHDEDLVRRLIQGDESAFDDIYDRYNRKIYLFSFRNLKNRQDAEGAVQEVFLNLWKDRRKLRKAESINAWLFSVSFNIIRKHFRRLASENKLKHQLSRTNSDEDRTTISELDYNDLMLKAESLIGKLPPRQQHIFLMSRKQGMSNEEISRMLHISEKTVENQISKAKRALRKAFLDESLISLFYFLLFFH